MQRLSSANISNYKKLNCSILKLYKEAFPYAVMITLTALLSAFFIDLKEAFVICFAVILAAFLFFRFTYQSSFVIRFQRPIHQIFVFLGVAAAIACFIRNPEMPELFAMLVIAGGASFLLSNQLVTIVYFIIYHALLLGLILFAFPEVKWAHIIYSLVFTSSSIFVSKWLNRLINNELNLQISERKYRSLFEEGNNAVLLLNMGKNSLEIVDANSECKEVFGFEKAGLIGQFFDDLSLDSEKKKNLIHTHVSKLKKQERFDTECSFARKDGSVFLGEVSFVHLHIEDEFVVQVVIKDISEQKLKEIELSETVQSFKNIVDNSPASILIFTRNKLVYKNSHGDRLYNQELNNKSEDLFHIFPQRHKYLLAELISEASDNVSSYTEISLGNESEEKRYSISLVNIVYNGENAIFLMLMDITLQNEYNIQKIRAEIAEETNKKLSEEIRKHKETQHDLVENTSKLNALFESSSNLFILTIDRDLKISSFNSSFNKMMKYYLGVDVKIGDDFLNTFPIEQAAYSKLIKKFKRALRGDSVEIISHFPSKKGETWVESFISPVRVEGEPIKEIAFIAHNITEKVENERRVLDSEANNRATVSAIPDMLFKLNKEGLFTDFRLNEEGIKLFKDFAHTIELKGKHISEVFKDNKVASYFMANVKKALKTGEVHTHNFTIPFIIGKTDKKMFYENRYSRINSNEVIVIARDVTDKVEFESRLIESVREKEVLLKEVHHRVKNNLQVISSILNLQSSYVEDEKTLEIINESQNRIRSMSYIHESLYQTKDFSSIDFHDYITNLVQNLVHSYQLYSGKTKLNLQIDRVQLILDQAIPCGLILNELVSNSLKYAYPEEEGGEIQVEIREEEGKVFIRVEDFGTGLPKGFKIEESDSLGLGLVDTLVDQIDGELILKTDKGTKYLIIFEKQDL